MTIILTDDQLTKLHAKAARLTEEAERLLAAAEASDDPDDWDAWKEADGIAVGHALALQAIAATGEDPDPALPSMSFTEWCETFRPTTNPLVPTAPCDGLLFETFGPEIQIVRMTDLARVWTLIEADDDSLYILSGHHTVNRLGYFITEAPWHGEDQMEIPYA
tara:strand:- start:60 stop:548 length:489 start_codon:yes stop_codon:yes gene_type:complete